MKLRDYQQKLEADIFEGFTNNHKAICAVAPTGSGKTRIKAHLFSKVNHPSCAIAHRQELVGQISLAMAEQGVVHSIIAPKPVVQFYVQQHIKLLGKSFYDYRSPHAVAGVDTLLRRDDSHTKQWLNSVRLWDIDECHHVQPDNKWGKAIKLFPNAVGVGFTATPIRADRLPLANSFDHMVIGPSMRELIDRKFLSEYKIYGVKSNLDINKIRMSQQTGDYNLDSLREETHKSSITGDIVQTYLKIAKGKLGITFAVDVEHATEIAAEFRKHGVPAEVVSAKTPDHVRTALMDKFKSRQILQLVNVDLFGEGVDVPAVEVVSGGRATMSYSLYIQQFGRVLRPAEGKQFGIYLDHVGNVHRHGLPDAPQDWSLTATERVVRKTVDGIPMTRCGECYKDFARLTKTCPYCGYVQEPASRSKPEFVDGDLFEYDEELLKLLRGEILRVDGSPLIPRGTPQHVAKAIENRWQARRAAAARLKDVIAQWAGVMKYGHDMNDSQIYRVFYHRFGVDILTSQTLSATESCALSEKILLTLH